MLTRAKRMVIDRLGISRVAEANGTNSAAIEALSSELGRQAAALDACESLSAELGAQRKRSDELEQSIIAQHQVIESLAAWKTVTTNSVVLGVLHPVSTPISVVLATRNRASLCERAVRSVLAQRHQHWQLVVVDDGSTDATADFLAGVTDARVTIVRTEGIGAAAARNAGVAVATGEWVAFLDDDNVMDHGWLHAVAMSAARMPSVVAFYGAQLRQHESPGHEQVASSMLFATPDQLAALRHDNRIDLGALAVRRSSPELRFDADLPRFIDWDLVVRLHAVHGLHPIAAWSGVYTTEASNRISERGGDAALAAFRARLADDGDPVGRPTTSPPD